MKPDDYQETPHFGEILWSDYFHSRIVIVHYRDDENWWFTTENSAVVHKARTRYSEIQKVVTRQASGTYDEYRPTATREHGDAVEAEREEQGR